MMTMIRKSAALVPAPVVVPFLVALQVIFRSVKLCAPGRPAIAEIRFGTGAPAIEPHCHVTLVTWILD
jgi:hypothetical protein